MRALREKTYDSLSSVLPITAIVLLLSISMAPLTTGALVLFFFGAVLLVAGMGLFTLGVDMSMLPMGEGVGVELAKIKKVSIPLLVCFVLGVVVTLAEPDLQVLSHQIPAIPVSVIILAVALGVGVALVIALLRVRLKVRLSHVLLVSYAVVFGLLFFTPNSFIAVAFDAGAVTTGPITVPFIMGLSIGMASMRNDKNSGSDSFGLVALGSVIPIVTMILLGCFYQPSGGAYTPPDIAEIITTQDAAREFLLALPSYAEQVFLAMVPILMVFVLFQLLTRRFRRHQLGRITMGLVYTYVGLVMFLTGVNVGFMPAGRMIGESLASGSMPWILVFVGLLVGFFIVRAEPAVQVLTRQVEDVSNGSITQHAMMNALSLGIALSMGLSMLRILTGLPILALLIPGYGLALGLTFVVPQIYTGIAFDSGGVTAGPMTTAFMLPLALGACVAVGGNVMTDAFGIVAMVAMTPLITLQLMGYFSIRKEKLRALRRGAFEAPGAGIVYFDDAYDDEEAAG